MNDLLETNPQLTTLRGLASAAELAETDHGALYSPSGYNAHPAPPATRSKPPGATGDLFARIKQFIAGQTGLSDTVCALITYWSISTWLQEALTIMPCLVITGPDHEAMVLLRVLHGLCAAPRLLAGFRRTDLKDLTGYRTLLISEPHLDKRTAALLGNLTNRGVMLIEQRSYLYCAGSSAIYVGDDLAIGTIQHSVCIDLATPRNAKVPNPGQLVQGRIDALRNSLSEYRTANLEQVRCLEFNPSGLSAETHAIANALGSCIVDEPELQAELVALLRPQAGQQLADRSDSLEGLVVGAAIGLCHQGKDQIYAREIAAEANRLQDLRGENLRLGPEKVGHKLKKLGLFTRRLSQAGNGLLMDRPTTVLLHELAASYGREDWMDEKGNLHCPLCAQYKGNEEVMEVFLASRVSR